MATDYSPEKKKNRRALALQPSFARRARGVLLTVHPGTGHAFMAPHNALGTHQPELATRIWPEAVAFLRSTLS